MDDRELILTHLPDAEPSGAKRQAPNGRDSTAKGNALETWSPPIPEALKGRNFEALWKIFAEKLPALGCKIVTLEDLKILKSKQAWIDEDARTLVGQFGPIEAKDIWAAEVGITLADCVVAESGSILLSNAPGRRRMGSLAPEIHVVLVQTDQIVATMEQALAKIPGRSSALITGSSRTADIEGILVRGVHGPREVWIVRIFEETAA